MPIKAKTDRTDKRNHYASRGGRRRRRWYNLAIWAKLRRMQLAREPLCEMECKDKGRTTAATEVDHIEDFGDSWELFVDPANHQSACKRCHSAKTMRANREKGRITGR